MGWSSAAGPDPAEGWYGGWAVKKVLLFSMEGNADGEAALAFFQSRGAAVDVRDVGRVPTIVIEERVFLGFGGHRNEIEALIRE